MQQQQKHFNMTGSYSLKIKLKFTPEGFDRLFRFTEDVKPGVSIIEREISKCVAHSIADLIEYFPSPDPELCDLPRELVRLLTKCEACQSFHRFFTKEVFRPVVSKEDVVFETFIKFKHRDFKLETAIAWHLKKVEERRAT